MEEGTQSPPTVVIKRHKKKRNVFGGLLSKRRSRVDPECSSSAADEESSAPEFSPDRLGKSALVENHRLKPTHNRLSGNFSFCCSTNHSLSPVDAIEPIVVRRNSLHLDLEAKRKVQKRLSSASFSPADRPTRLVRPVSNFNSIQKPITASVSRFRDRYLPPIEGGGLPPKERTPTQHFSTPDIASVVPLEEFKSARKSISCISVDAAAGTTTTEEFDDDPDRVVSAGSLACQAMLAAQVLHLIPAEKAKQRNYMHGQLAAHSLLGTLELDRMLPGRDVRIFVGTWNMNGQAPPTQMNDLVFPTRMESVPDMIVLGTQESWPEKFEFEVQLQETIGPSHVLFHSACLGTLHLAVFLRRDLIWYCSMPEDDSFSVRPGTAFRTKGAVAICFSLFGTSFLFVTSHLTAHQQKVKERVSDVKRIIHALDLPRALPLRHKGKDVTNNFDVVFFCGDLNFRLAEPRANLLRWIETTSFPLPEHLPHGFLHTDQLTNALSDGAAFKGFREAKITFPPTYKYDPGTQRFDTSSKQRAPAYTDRILYKFKMPLTLLRRNSTEQPGSLPVVSIAYDSVPSIVTSDHKPVWALFKCTVRPGVDSIPLAAGLFNREVYLEGMRRRLDSKFAAASTVCTIQ